MEEIKKFLKGFAYAGQGIIWCLKNERNMRFHFTLSLYMYSYLLFYDFFEISKAELAAIILAGALVLSLELMNTAVEKAVDLVTDKTEPLAKISKDTAAGAVLVAAIFSVILGIVIMFQPAAFAKMFEYYKNHIYMLVILIISLIVTAIYILLGSNGIKEKIKGCRK